MHCLPHLTAIAALLLALPAAAQEEVHYTAYAREAGVDVRSGPGDEFYVTDRLTQGAEITVYREDSGDWLAIQPTEKSFSLVARSSLKPGAEPGVAEVVADKVEAWVGSHVAASRLLAQVRLDRGELVTVLGHREALLAPGGVKQRFYEIAPPAGEFRWIRASDVSREPPFVEPDWFADEKPDDEDKSDSTDPSLLKPNIQAREPRFSEWKTKGSVRSEPGDLPGRPLPTDDLDQLHVQLSTMVAQPAQHWDLRDLKATAEHLVDNGPSAVERGRARQLLERIKSFETVQLREKRIGAPLVVAKTREGTRADDVVGTGLATGTAETSTDPSYDGTGWLMKLHSTGDAPPYVLKDNNDRVVQLITPTPGLNLNRYLKKRVGIFGRRGHVARFDLPHVTAARVVELDRHRR